MNKIWKSHFKINIKSIVLFIASKDISVRFDQTSLQICLCLIFPLDLIQEVMVLKLNQTYPEIVRVWRELSPTKQDSKTLVESMVIQPVLVYKSWYRGCMEKKGSPFVSLWLKPLPWRRWWTSNLRTNKLWMFFTSLIFSMLATSHHFYLPEEPAFCLQVFIFSVNNSEE